MSLREEILPTEALLERYKKLSQQISEVQAKETAERDLYFFCENILGYRDLDPELHGGLCAELMDTTKMSKLILFPRGHLKSSVATKGFPIWLLINNPDRRVGMFNYSEPLVVSFLRNIRDHFERNPIFRDLWGHLIPEGDNRQVWNQQELLINRSLIDSTPSIQAMSILANTTGSHHDIHIYDDLVNKNSVQTAEAIAKLHDQVVETQCIINPPRDEDPYVGMRVFIGTRWHWSDEYQRIIDNHSDDPDWSIKVRRATENGKVIFPQLFNLKILAQKRRELGAWHYSAQYENEPVDEDNAHFPPSMVKCWSGSRRDFLERNYAHVFMGIDPAASTEGSDDHWGIVVGAMISDGRMYGLDCLSTDGRGLRSEDVEENEKRLYGRIAAMIQRWGVMKVGMEATGFQLHVMTQLEKECKFLGVETNFIPLSHHNMQKARRIMTLVPEFENERVYLHDEGCEDLRLQLIRYPRAGKDDLLDGMELMMRVASPPDIPGSYEGVVLPGTTMHAMKETVKKRRQADRQAGLARQGRKLKR